KRHEVLAYPTVDLSAILRIEMIVTNHCEHETPPWWEMARPEFQFLESRFQTRIASGLFASACRKTIVPHCNLNRAFFLSASATESVHPPAPWHPSGRRCRSPR